MNRRNFLSWFFGSAAVSIFVPRLVVAPPSALITAGGFAFHREAFTLVWGEKSGNVFVTPDLLSREMLNVLKANLELTVQINRDYLASFERERLIIPA